MSSLKLTLHEERIQWREGRRFVAGIDEAGRGPLAGPVVAAAVILPQSVRGKWRAQVADSKLLTAVQRESLYPFITRAAVSYGVGVVDACSIDLLGIAVATRRAMQLAVAQLSPAPDCLLIDYFRLPEVNIQQKGVREGDSLCFSIACASIVAKVTRDRLMLELERQYPGYYFAEHKGYGTKKHLECLRRLGPSPEHRVSFTPVRDCLAATV